MKEIQLTQDKVALVDDDLFEYLNSFKWHAKWKRSTYYAYRRPNVYMHRVIAEIRG